MITLMKNRLTIFGLFIIAIVLILACIGCQGEEATPPESVATPTQITATTPTPTLDSTPSPTVSRTPSPTRPPIDGSLPCIEYFSIRIPPHQEDFLRWTPNGAQLVLSSGDNLKIVAVDASSQRTLADANPLRGRFLYSFYAHVSHDGSHIVYSTCQYRSESIKDPYNYWGGQKQYNYELAVINADGTIQGRLTDNEFLDHYPVWSPDGKRIAFLRSTESDGFYNSSSTSLFTMNADGAEESLVTDGRIALYPPVWSPDGQRLAFIANEGENLPFTKVLHTVSVDGTELTRVGETTTLGSWTADSQEVTYAVMEDQEAVIFSVKPDGTDKRELWRSGPDEEVEVEEGTPVIQVYWSPGGSELMFIYDWLYVIEKGGEEPQRVVEVNEYLAPLAAWSPDGSKIAIYYPEGDLFTVTRDGSDQRNLGRATKNGNFILHRPPPTPPPVDIGACSNGVVVPQPEANSGLVRDCEVLLDMRNTLVGHGPIVINWNEETPLSEWAGIVIDGSPPRIHELEGRPGGLKGSIPPQIGLLTELRRIEIRGGGSGVDANELQGPLPKELSNLTNLAELILWGNDLMDPIPPELGKLKNLTRLWLSGNNLSGSIPPELAEMESLKSLDLALNNLTGNIPVELAQLDTLSSLGLGGNELIGSIPPELAELVRLRTLYLNDNNLSGEIPAELAQLEDMNNLKLEGNDLSGCMAEEFPELWVEASGLPRCDSGSKPKQEATATP